MPSLALLASLAAKGSTLNQDAPDLQQLDTFKQSFDAIRAQIATAVVGQDEVIEQLLICVFARGHCILEGVPGLAKTLLISTLAKSLSLSFNRIQFTPDLMPSDITGTEVMRQDRETGERSFQFMPGPVFANLLLADEINRTPPKTQAALLQGMQERHVSSAGRDHALPDPFFVLATQNPIEQEGTYPLPEAQLDRFFMKVFVTYPTPEEERDVYRLTTSPHPSSASTDSGDSRAVRGPSPVVGEQQVRDLQKLVRAVPISDTLIDYAMRLIRSTRPQDPLAPDFVSGYALWGVGPRGGQSLILAAKARAALHGRPEVALEDFHAAAPSVLRHRLVLNYHAEAEGETPDTVIAKLIETVSIEGGAAAKAARLDTVLKA